MPTALIACRSVTYAQRAIRILNRRGIKASMRRLSVSLPETGCGNAVAVDMERLNHAVMALRESGMPVRAVYLEHEDGTLEAFHDIP